MKFTRRLFGPMFLLSSLIFIPACSKDSDSKTSDSNRGLIAPKIPCKTQYPVILIHGVGGRDSLLGVNYFGRIPKHLEETCAIEVFQGEQDAFGFADTNADQLLRRILHITDELGHEKVNIIAHSKGGLDTRFMFFKNKGALINGRTVNDRVASFTSLSTPHRGSVLANYLFDRIPDTAENILSIFLDLFGRVQGDSDEANARAALDLLKTETMAQWNAQLGDLDTGIEGVYSQSWAAHVSGAIHDPIFQATSAIMRSQGKPINDGAVEEDSAIYGHYRGTVGSGWVGGVSHMAIVDKAAVVAPGVTPGFDPRKFYESILTELSSKGF